MGAPGVACLKQVWFVDRHHKRTTVVGTLGTVTSLFVRDKFPMTVTVNKVIHNLVDFNVNVKDAKINKIRLHNIENTFILDKN